MKTANTRFCRLVMEELCAQHTTTANKIGSNRCSALRMQQSVIYSFSSVCMNADITYLNLCWPLTFLMACWMFGRH